MSESVIQIAAFDDLIASIEDFVAISTELGAPLIDFAFLVKDAFDKCRDLISYGLYNRAPENIQVFFQQDPLAAAIRKIQDFRESNRASADFFNHLSTVSESIVALSWIAIKQTPAPFVRDMFDAGQYFGNRVLKDKKGNTLHTSWINKYYSMMSDLEHYIKEHFRTGFTWGLFLAQMNSGTCPPGIPPPPPAPMPCAPVDAGSLGDGNRQALLSQLNQGTAITSLLRPVGMREARDVPSVQPGASSAKPVAKAQAQVKPPKCLLEGRKWVVENYKDNQGININNDNMSQSLVMFNCVNSALEVRNKINNVVIDSCKRINLVLRDVISSVDVIRCDRLVINCQGKVPLINVDNSESIQVFVNEDRDVEVISSKSTSCNICLVKPDGDYVELAVPEQIRVVIQDEHLLSTVVEKI